jgi:eukaryotic translation initiation factor 2C
MDDGQPALKRQRIAIDSEATTLPFNSIHSNRDVLAPFPEPAAGRRVNVTANCKRITNFNYDMQFFQYDLQMDRIKEGIAKRASKEEDRLKLWVRLRRTCRELFADASIYWDGGSALFSNQRLNIPEGGITERITLPRFELTVTLKRARVEEVDMRTIQEHQNGSRDANPQQALQALEVAMRSTLEQSNNWHSVKRKFFDMNLPSVPTAGAQIFKGLSHAFFPGGDSLYVRSDICTTVFYDTTDLLDVLSRDVKDGWLRYSAPEDAEQYARLSKKAAKLLKGKKITLKYRDSNHTIVVAGVEDRPAFAQTFKLGERKEGEKEQEEDSREDKSVIEYLEDRYKIKFHRDDATFPCVRVRGRDGPTFYPISQCRLAPGNPYDNSRGQPPRHVSDIIKVMNVRPQDRFREAHDMLENAWNQAHVSDNLGLRFDESFAQVSARFIEPPQVGLGSGPIRHGEVYRFDFRNKRVFRGATIDNWGVVTVGVRERPDDFAREFEGMMRKMGVNVQGRAVVLESVRDGRDVERCFEDIGRNFQGSQPPLIICPLANEGDYGLIKKAGDRLGFTTQCLQARKMYRNGRANPQYVANVVLKINSKMGGIDKAIAIDGSGPNDALLQQFFSAPTMVCGLSMSEEMPGMETDRYSVVSLVGSLDPFADQYAHSARNIPRGVRTVDGETMKALFKDVLYQFKQTTGILPQNILFYRSGVSAGSVPSLLEQEAAAILELGRTDEDIMGANGGSAYEPKVTMILMQRRHHMRFMTRDREYLSKDNIKPGIVVDSGVTNNSIFEFYLFSHSGLQGTSCPSHYRVLLNDIEELDSNKKIQDLTFYLSFVYAKTLSPVSMVVPCYYALNNANRHAKYSRDDDVSEFGRDTYLMNDAMKNRNIFN